MKTIAHDDRLAVAVTDAIHAGDTAALRRLLDDNEGLATAHVVDHKGHHRSLLHLVTDWPGHFPNGAQGIVAALIEAGADVNARFVGPHRETPLHWAASCDDVSMIHALLDAGADLEADGSVIDGGTALADAVAFGQWNAARALVERGARPNLWQAAALGLMDSVRDTNAGPDEITSAFWCACHGGQREAAEYLLAQGAELNWKGYDGLTPLQAAERSQAIELAAWLRAQGAH